MDVVVTVTDTATQDMASSDTVRSADFMVERFAVAGAFTVEAQSTAAAGVSTVVAADTVAADTARLIRAQ
jgi:hypothetical protein